MNKKLIALAVAGAIATPMMAQADDSGPNLYGRINLALGINDDDANLGSDSILDVSDVVSRFGIRGEEDLGNGLAAVYRYEFRVNADQGNLSSAASGKTQRLSYAGLKGGFGQVIIGSIWSTFYNTVGTYLDPTYTLGYFGYSSFAGGDYRTDNAIQYSGNFGPVGVSAQLQIDGGNDADDSVDRWSIGATYGIGPITLAAAYDSEKTATPAGADPANGDGEDKDRFGVAAGYGGDGYSVNIGYQTYTQDGSNGGSDVIDRSMWTINGGVDIGESNRLYAQYWDGSDDAQAGDDKDGIVLGFYHSLSSRTRLYFEGTQVGVDGTTANADIKRYLLGLRHDF